MTSFPRFSVRKLVAALVLGAVALIGIWCWSVRVTDATLVAECRQHYARARSQADTLRIDETFPERSGKGQAALNCGALRHAYPDSSR